VTASHKSPAPSSSARRCWARIDLGALAHNARAVAAHIGPRAGILAVVKADAYGHGLAETARTLAPHVRMFGVANLAEARELRAAVPGARVLLLSPALPDEREPVAAEGFEPAISGFAEAAAYSAVTPADHTLRVHLSIDTGMGRMGVAEPEAVEVFRSIRALPRLRVEAVATHLPCADEDEPFTRSQLARFGEILRALRAVDPELPLSHSLNSAGLLAFPDHAPDLVRAGLVLYGVSPLSGFQSRLRPALSMHTRVALVRELAPGSGISYGRTFLTRRPTRAATLCAGYADGYPRHLSGSGASVLVKGTRCPLLGRVTMDQIVVDVTDLPEPVEPGEEAVLLGSQGEAAVTAAELAERAGTIPWEIFTGMQCRDGRVHVGEEFAA